MRLMRETRAAHHLYIPGKSKRQILPGDFPRHSSASALAVTRGGPDSGIRLPVRAAIGAVGPLHSLQVVKRLRQAF